MSFILAAASGFLIAVSLLVVCVTVAEMRRRKKWQRACDKRDEEDMQAYWDAYIKYALGKGDDADFEDFVKSHGTEQ